jgi:hypothetical protein
MLLGDADLCKEAGTKTSYYLKMKEKKTFELEYALYKQKTLSYLTKCEIKEFKTVELKQRPSRSSYATGHIMLNNAFERASYHTDYVTISTKTHPMYSKLHEHMYHEDRKSLDEHSVKCISLRGLAILFQDKGRFEEETRIPCLRLPHLNSVEKGVFTRILQKKFKLQWRIDGPNIRLRKKDIEVFLNSISAYLHPSKIKSNDEKRTEPRVSPPKI